MLPGSDCLAHWCRAVYWVNKFLHIGTSSSIQQLVKVEPKPKQTKKLTTMAYTEPGFVLVFCDCNCTETQIAQPPRQLQG